MIRLPRWTAALSGLAGHGSRVHGQAEPQAFRMIRELAILATQMPLPEGLLEEVRAKAHEQGAEPEPEATDHLKHARDHLLEAFSHLTAAMHDKSGPPVSLWMNATLALFTVIDKYRDQV